LPLWGCSSQTQRYPASYTQSANYVDISRQRLRPQRAGSDSFVKVKKNYKNHRSESQLQDLEVDFNGDGRIDFVQIYHPVENWIQKEHADLDGDGEFDVSYYYKLNSRTGRPELAAQRFTNHYNGGRSSWKYFRNGKLSKREIDLSGQGRPNYWEYYQNNQITRIDRDLNGDGIPDPVARFRKQVRSNKRRR